MPYFESPWWKVELPVEWKGRNDPECATFEREGAVGALQISAAQKDGEVNDDDLREFADEHLAAGAKAYSATAGDFVGFKLQYRDGVNCWRQWFLRHKSIAVFATYNCPISSEGVEDQSVDAILGTLRAQHVAL